MRLNLIIDKGLNHSEKFFGLISNTSDFHLLFSRPQFVNGKTEFTLSVLNLITGYFILITHCQLTIQN